MIVGGDRAPAPAEDLQELLDPGPQDGPTYAEVLAAVGRWQGPRVRVVCPETGEVNWLPADWAARVTGGGA